MGLAGVAGKRCDLEWTKKGEERIVKADERAVALQYCCQHVVVHQFLGGPAKIKKRIQEAAVQGFLLLAVSELQVDKTAVALDHGHAVEFAACFFVEKRSEVPPVYLELLARRRLKTDKGSFDYSLSSNGPQIIF